MRESTTYQAILEEGRVEGEAKGRLDEVRRLLQLQGEELYGSPPDSKSASLIEGSNDLDQLERLLVRLPRCENWQELLKGFSSRRPTRRRR